MNIIYDLIFVAILLISVRRGSRNGFLSTVFGLVGWLVALFCCMMWSETAARWLYDSFVHEKLLSTVAANLPADLIAAVNSGAASSQEALQSLQQSLNSLGSILGPQFSGIDTSAAGAVLSTFQQDGGTLAQIITDQILQPIAMKFLGVIASIGIFVIVLVVFSLLRRLTRARRHPAGFLGKSNRFLGGVLGFGEGIVSCYFYTLVLSLLVSLTGGSLNWLNAAVLQKTWLVSLFL